MKPKAAGGRVREGGSPPASPRRRHRRRPGAARGGADRIRTTAARADGSGAARWSVGATPYQDQPSKRSAGHVSKDRVAPLQRLDVQDGPCRARRRTERGFDATQGSTTGRSREVSVTNGDALRSAQGEPPGRRAGDEIERGDRLEHASPRHRVDVGRSLSTRLTVPRPTPAARATSWMVAGIPLSSVQVLRSQHTGRDWNRFQSGRTAGNLVQCRAHSTLSKEILLTLSDNLPSGCGTGFHMPRSSRREEPPDGRKDAQSIRCCHRRPGCGAGRVQQCSHVGACRRCVVSTVCGGSQRETVTVGGAFVDTEAAASRRQ